MSLPNTSFLPVVPLSIPFKKSPNSFLNCCSLTCLFLGVRTWHVHTYLQTAEAAPPLTSIPITMLAVASPYHYTRQKQGGTSHHNWKEKLEQPDSRGCTSPNLHPDHHARCCISLSLHKAKTGWHFPPQLKWEAGTTYHNLQRIRHATSIDVIYTNHLVIYTIIQQQEQNALYFFGIPFPWFCPPKLISPSMKQ